MAPNAPTKETRDLIRHLDRVETVLADGLDRMNASIDLLREPVNFLQCALESYRKKYLEQALQVNRAVTKWGQVRQCVRVKKIHCSTK